MESVVLPCCEYCLVLSCMQMAIRERMADLDGDFRENTRSLSISRDKLKDSDLVC